LNASNELRRLVAVELHDESRPASRPMASQGADRMIHEDADGDHGQRPLAPQPLADLSNLLLGNVPGTLIVEVQPNRIRASINRPDGVRSVRDAADLDAKHFAF